jgi:hypothetical protein
VSEHRRKAEPARGVSASHGLSGNVILLPPGTPRPPVWAHLPGTGWEYSAKDAWHLRIRPRPDGQPGVMLDTCSYGTGLWSAHIPPDVIPDLIAALHRYSRESGAGADG